MLLKDQRVDCSDIAKKVVACFSMPRLTFTEHMFAVMNGIGKTGITYIVRGTASWHKSLTMAMDEAIAGGAEYILTLDHDSIFCPADVIALYGLMKACPQADAIMAMEQKRENDEILAAQRGEDGKLKTSIPGIEFRDDLMRCACGHFGLTILRVSALKTLSRPWFVEKHDPAGGWGIDSMDADIAFWRHFDAEGFALFQANRIVIGHAHLMIAWPGRDLRPMYQRIEEYKANGKPEGAWQ